MQDSDDARESPAIKLIRLLFDKGVQVSAADPAATEKARKVLGEKDIEYLKGLPDENRSFDAVVLMTAWKEYVDYLYGGGCKAPDIAYFLMAAGSCRRI